MRACTLTVAKVSGKSVTTTEGLSAREREVYAWAFGEVGAVQCGFCMPGMVMSAKALLDAKSHSDCGRGEVRHPLQSVPLHRLREGGAGDSIGRAGAARRRDARGGAGWGRMWASEPCAPDAKEKLLGAGEFVDDMQVAGMLYGAVLRAKYPRALVKKIDITGRARIARRGVVLTAKDVPGERLLGHVVYDWPVMIAEGEETRYVGDALALVAATTKEAARKARRTDWRGLRGARAAAVAASGIGRRALRACTPNGNVLATTVVKRGDVDRAIAKAKHVVTQHYSTPRQEHAFLEPESALAVPTQLRIVDRVYRRPGRLRRPSRDCAHARASRTKRCASSASLWAGGSAARKTCRCSITRRCWRGTRASR